MLIIERWDPIEAVNNSFNLDIFTWSNIGILVPGLHDDGQWDGTEKWICAESFAVTLKEYEEWLC